MKPEKLPDTESIASVGMPHGHPVHAEPDDSIQLEACFEHEWIAIRTRRSVYDVVVLSGNTGEVMVRGGRFFPEFRRATVTGSIFSAGVRLGSICVGMHLLLDDGERPVITSLIQTVSRPAHCIAEAALLAAAALADNPVRDAYGRHSPLPEASTPRTIACRPGADRLGVASPMD